jgi:hypothetical protein
MRVERLSDYPADLVAAAEREWRHGATEQEARLQAVRQERDKARSAGRWLTWLRLAFAVGIGKRATRRQHVLSRSPKAAEEEAAAGLDAAGLHAAGLHAAGLKKARAGHEAELRVEEGLGRALGDDWTLFRGYSNARGEIDGLLLGPRGLFAIEVKHHNGTVYIAGDDWSSEKYDKYGNRVRDRTPMRDGSGRRSPSQQLTEPSGLLADFLGRRAQQVTPRCVVVLTHPNARVGAIKGPSVQVVTSVRELLTLVDQSTARLDPARLREIAGLIRRDHHYWESRKRA